jgi:phosphate starvation-inducible protein PhoH
LNTEIQTLQFALEPVDNQRPAHLCGPRDENLRQTEAALEVGTAPSTGAEDHRSARTT